jgi:uncharacterized protein YacL
MAIIYIFFLIVVLLLLLPTILISILKSILSIFGLNVKRNRTQDNTTIKNDTSFTSCKTNDVNEKKQRRKKIFDKNDGEYVDFEEIK